MASKSSASSKLPSDQQPMTPRGCALGCAIWLIIMSIPVFGFYIATQNELEWRRGPENLEVDRVWLVNEPNSAGLAYLSARVTRNTSTDMCVQTNVQYFLWRTQETNQNAMYEEYFTRDAVGLTLAAAKCP